jgi:hypothetical protein
MARRQLMRHPACWLVRVAVLTVLAGAPPSQADGAPRDVPFETLAVGESSTAGAPMLKVAGTPRQAAELAHLAGPPDIAARLAAVDFRARTVIGVFTGPMGSSGHRITVRAVLAGADVVRIVAERIPPRQEQNVNDVISYPYAIIAVPRAPMPARATWSVVSTAGEPLVEPRRR